VLPQGQSDVVVLTSVCRHTGEMTIHAEIGPGFAVKAMTYWKTTPEAFLYTRKRD
jgi:hypothetical protein